MTIRRKRLSRRKASIAAQFLLSGETLAAVGKKYSLTRERVRQIVWEVVSVADPTCIDSLQAPNLITSLRLDGPRLCQLIERQLTVGAADDNEEAT